MRKLGILSIAGIDFALSEATPNEDPRLDGAYGVTHPESCSIVVRSGMSPSCFRNVVLHEVLHGIWEHSGIREVLRTNLEMEEAAIQVLTPHLIAALASMRKLRV